MLRGITRLLEFRWDNDRDYQKLYYRNISTETTDPSGFCCPIKPQTAFMKLTVTVPDYFDSKLRAKRIAMPHKAGSDEPNPLYRRGSPQ